ncbi:MAG: SDR family oxidoreductase [Rhizobacter sp.]|nr:SDR family oxidoreductase [Ferruginibacter sp.]
MLLKNKNAIIYGAGPSIGGAVARAFAREGANVFVTGRSGNALDKLVDEIVIVCGCATAAILNAMDENEVQAHIDKVLQEAGSVDISFNAIGLEDKQGINLVDMVLPDIIRPGSTAMQTQFITATAEAMAMIKQGSGVILSAMRISQLVYLDAYVRENGISVNDYNKAKASSAEVQSTNRMPVCCSLEDFGVTKTRRYKMDVHPYWRPVV